MIKYLGRLAEICQMCGKYSSHIYLDSKESMRGLFPEVEWKDLHICEKCARRETGNKYWQKVKRKV